MVLPGGSIPPSLGGSFHQPHFDMTSSAVKIPSKLTRAVLFTKNQNLESSNEGLSRRVKNLEQEVTVLFAIAAGLAVTAILF